MARAKFNIKGKYGKKQKRVVGDVRQSQVVSVYGVGAIVDFLRDTVIIAGVDEWDADMCSGDFELRKIFNENLRSLAGVKYFIEPKIANDTAWSKSKDIPAYVFPEWLYCPKCKRIVSAKEAANVNQGKSNKCFLNRSDGKRCGGILVASRFVLVCENGHLEDFPYSWWIHRGELCSAGRNPQISMFNVGDRSDIDSLYVKCEGCGKTVKMAGAFSSNAFAGEDGYRCKGNHPHLKTKQKKDGAECSAVLKTRLRSSSSIYFPVTLSALSIPPWSRDAVKIIESKYDDLLLMGGAIETYLKSKSNSTVTYEQLLEAYEIVRVRRGSASPRSEADVYYDEYKVLSEKNITSDDREYSAFLCDLPYGFEPFFEQVTVVDKLTVVEALAGFTRLQPWSGDNDGNNPDRKKIAPLSSYPKEWLPAVQLKGEGIFVRFREDALELWKKQQGKRYERMAENLENSCLKSRNDRFSPEYVFLHTFTHLLIRQLSNECGYSASSLKEKIYSTFKHARNTKQKMHGVLIYLASSDCDGSLGGLIGIAQNPEKFRTLLKGMLQKSQWCSADPLCITSTEQGVDSLNYSACHDCVLLPETSCEFRNVLLDRAAVVGTPEHPEIGFLSGLL